ncbi:hypothetical protein BD410DRAFT_796626 [Rickenella mellea]|uniref:Uncharacterized protein n=1 Tax=Rickenella mellea TaxID=50990 RepID=A0A4Y7PJC5_9AGAM|nr:hypothetical protein BD410DRAFT_796626 [Rickenella mellea]
MPVIMTLACAAMIVPFIPSVVVSEVLWHSWKRDLDERAISGNNLNSIRCFSEFHHSSNKLVTPTY